MSERDEDFLWDVVLPAKKSSFSDIRSQKPARAVVKIFCGQAYERSFCVPLVVGRKLLVIKKRGQARISNLDELNTHIERLMDACLSQKIEDMISRKDWGKQELASKLLDLGYASTAVQARIDRLEQALVIDDRRYVELFISSKRNLGWGPNKIALELKRKKLEVPPHTRLMEIYEQDESEYDIAKRALARKSFHGNDPYAKVMRFLISRGFSFSVAKAQALRYSQFDD